MAALVLAFSTVAGVITPRIVSATTGTNTVRNMNTGEEFSTIQAAIDDSDTADGHKIRVFDGTYEENVSIDKNITLESKNGPASTTIAPTSGRAIELLGQHDNMKDVTIRGFTLTSGSTNAIILQANSQANDGYDYTNLHYRDLVINANGGTGIGLFDVDGIKIRNVTTTDAHIGIESVGVKNLTLRNSSISGSNTGFNVKVASGYEANNGLIIEKTNFTGNSQAAIVNGATDVTFFDNDVSGGYLGFTLKGVTDGQVRNNTFDSLDGGTSNNPTGVWLHNGVDNVKVRNNTFTNITATGKSAQAILVGDSASNATHNKVTINNNTVDGVNGNSGGYGVMVNFETTNLAVTNNTFKNISGTGWTVAVALDAPTPGAKVTGNDFSDLGGAAVGVSVNLREGNTANPAQIKVRGNNFYLPSGQFGVVYDFLGTTPRGTLDAKKNYWNDQKGPSGPFGNLSSTGAMVGPSVAYSPWLCYPAPSNKTTTDGNCLNIPTPTNPESDTNPFYTGDAFTQKWSDESTSGAVKYEYQSCYQSTQPATNECPLGVTTWENTYTGTSKHVGANQPDSHFFWHVRAVNATGDKSDWSEWREIVIDSTAPVVSLTGPADSSILNGLINVTGEVLENFKLSHYNLSLYPGTTNLSDGDVHSGDRLNGLVGWGSGTVNTGGTVVDVDRGLDTTLLPDGEYQLRLAARDAAQNRDLSDPFNGGTSSVHVIAFTVDNTAPEAATGPQVYFGHTKSGTPLSCSLGDGPIYTNTDDILVDWSHANPGDVAYYWFGIDNANNYNEMHKNSRDNPGEFADSGTAYKVDITSPNNNPHHYLITAVDAAGNKSALLKTCPIILDQESPAINITNVSEDPISGEVTIEGTASDNYGLRPLRISFRHNNPLSGPVLTLNPDSFSGGVWSLTLNTNDYSQLTDGDYRIVARANDLTGTGYSSSNTSADTWDVTIDNTAPAVDAGDDDDVTGLEYGLAGTASDAETGVASTLWTLVSGPGTATFDDDGALGTDVTVSDFGTYTFKLTITDNAGNVSEDTVEVIFEEPPVLGFQITRSGSGDQSNQNSGNSGNQNNQENKEQNNTEENQVLNQTTGNDDGENGNTKDTEVIATTAGNFNIFSWWWVLALVALLFGGYYYLTRPSKSKN